VLIESKHTEFDLRRLDRRHDPRGVAIVWALLAVCAVLVACTVVTVAWVIGR
jgi:hypothetical protein